MNVTRMLSGRSFLKCRVEIRSTLIISLFLLLLPACKSRTQSETESGTSSGDKLELTFTYGSEKEKWINEVTDAFNRSDHRTANGKRIFVRAFPMGSGEAIDEVMEGRRQPHIISPASAAFIKLGNAQSQSKYGKDLITSTDNLVLSPVVIAMWKPMAEALGWGKKPIGWSDILALARSQKGWEAYGYPQWGRFKFGHTHPQFSNSGLISLFAEVYAASGKTAGLTVADVNKPHTAEFLSGIEKSVVHYGSSTGFFGRQMFSTGPQYLSAAVLYENMVIESYSQSNLPFPVVAIYPKEGTFWSDHPIGIVERDWVTAEHREGAKAYIQYLLQRPQQEKAITYGFRPGAVDVPLASPIDAAHGVDPKEPKTTLEVPSVPVIDGILSLWQQKKKAANIVLVMDTSGSMNDNGKIQNAREGAKQLVNLLSDGDHLSLLPFSSKVAWAGQDVLIKTGRPQLSQTVDSLFAQGGTALYDSIEGSAILSFSTSCNGLIEFIESSRTLDDIHGQEKVKAWLRQDIALWRQGDVAAMPKGYLVCGPVGTGKTYMVECLAGEAGVPVVKLKNFRDKWVGSTEGNLERIFRLLQALGRCYVFVDEADQAIGRRDSSSGDSGISGRIYSMLAEEMGSSTSRGKLIWILASSRPDLIEVDLKRPGRIDVKIPLFPTTTPQESFGLIRMLCKKRSINLEENDFAGLEPLMPLLLTPGAAETLAVKIYRIVRTSKFGPLDALRSCLTDYQNPVPLETLESQIRLAVAEASDLEFVPSVFRGAQTARGKQTGNQSEI